MVSASIPPSTSTNSRRCPAADELAGQPHLGQHLGHELLAAEAGLDGHHQQRVELAQQLQVGLERRARLDRQPGQRAGRADRAGRLHRVGGRLDVEGDVVPRRPRRSPGAQRSGSSIIRWQSSGRSVALCRLCTTGSPRVRFGTKWASITSTCSQSAPLDRVGGLGRAGRSRPPGCSARSSARRCWARCLSLGTSSIRRRAASGRSRRSSAQNIASVPCRCGHSCTVGPAPEVGHPGERRAGVDAASWPATTPRRRSPPGAASR